MRTQWTTKGNRDAGSSCSCDRGLHRYLRNFGGGLNPPNTPPPSVSHWVEHNLKEPYAPPCCCGEEEEEEEVIQFVEIRTISPSQNTTIPRQNGFSLWAVF